MFKETEFRELCAKRKLTPEDTDAAVESIMTAEKLFSGSDGTLATVDRSAFEKYLGELAAAGKSGENLIIAFARYFSILKNDTLTIRLLAYLLPIGVLEAMSSRIESLEGKETARKVFESVDIPNAGCSPEGYAAATKIFVEALERVTGTKRAEKILAWNVHGIPAAAHEEERKLFLEAPSIDDWLLGLHERKVKTLSKHAEDGTLWFEQKITREVVEYVRSNPEILGGVREGNKIFVTKIPYNIIDFLAAKTPLARRKASCHCPLAASSITETGADVPALWCACSAGYEKFLFDIVFGADTEVEMIESVLGGSELCRYTITIPENILSR